MAVKKKFKLSDFSINSYGFRLFTPGINMVRFTDNPVMLYLHDQSKLLGKWDGLKIEDNGEMYGETDFNSKNTFAAEKEQEVDAGYLKGASLGIVPPFQFALYKDCKKDLALPAGERWDDNDLVLIKCTASEASLCPIPSNQNALQMFDDNGVMLTLEKLNAIKLSFQKNSKPDTQMDRNMIIATLVLKADVTDAEVQLTMQNLKNKETGSEAELKRLREMEATNKENLIKLTLDKGEADKRFLPTQRTHYEKLLRIDFDGTKALIDSITPAVNLAAMVGANGSAGASVVAGRESWKFKDWMKNDGNGLQLMMDSDRPKFNELYKAEFGCYPTPPKAG